MKPTISIIVPALNERFNLIHTIVAIEDAVKDNFSDYEILIFNDASTDGTGKIADCLVKSNSKIKVFHNCVTEGLAWNYRTGVWNAKYDYITWVPGDNETESISLNVLYSRVGQADIVIPYPLNMNVRPLGRRLLSCLFTFIIDMLFGLRLKYLNGLVIYKAEVIKNITIKTDSFAYQAEALVKALRCGHSYIETGIFLNRRTYGKSKALSFKNFIGVMKAIFNLWREVR